MNTLDEKIKIEREALEAAIFPRERMEHAEKLARLEQEKRYRDNTKPEKFSIISRLGDKIITS